MYVLTFKNFLPVQAKWEWKKFLFLLINSCQLLLLTIRVNLMKDKEIVFADKLNLMLNFLIFLTLPMT